MLNRSVARPIWPIGSYNALVVTQARRPIANRASLTRPRLRLAGIVVTALPFLGIFFPISEGGILAYPLRAAADLVLLVMLALLLLRPGGNLELKYTANSDATTRRAYLSPSKSKLLDHIYINSAMIVLILGVCSLFSPCQEVRYLGYGGPYLLLALLFALNLRDVVPHANTLFLLNVILISLGLISHFKPDLVQAFFADHYSAFRPGPELVEEMLQSGKPVLSFVTHSLAAFFFWLFFYLNWQTWERRGKVLYIGFSLSYMLLALMLQSFSGYAVVVIGLLVILHTLVKRRSGLGILAIVTCLSLIGLVAARGGVGEGVIDSVYETANSRENGILGRYTGNGPGVLSLGYLSQNPLRPIGLGYSSDLPVISDSGLIELAVRGSFPLVLVVYGGFWWFLRRNVKWRRSRIVLFAAFMAFELGFSNLLYFRTLYLLPFAVAYLNSLEGARSAAAQKCLATQRAEVWSE